MTTNGEDAEPEARPQPSHPRPLRRTGDFLGKHRLSAAISRLNQEIQYLQAELDEIETMKPSSAACKAVVLSTEGKSDALLPVTPGPENPAWHRWFQRVPSSHSRKWWTHKGQNSCPAKPSETIRLVGKNKLSIVAPPSSSPGMSAVCIIV